METSSGSRERDEDRDKYFGSNGSRDVRCLEPKGFNILMGQSLLSFLMFVTVIAMFVSLASKSCYMMVISQS